MTTAALNQIEFRILAGAKFDAVTRGTSATIKARDVRAIAFGFVIASAILTAPVILGRVYGTKCSNQYEVNSPAWTQCVLKAKSSREVDIANR